MNKSYEFTVESASQQPGELTTSGTCEYPFPSIEYFFDEYLEMTVGFTSTYPVEEKLNGWIEANFNEMADMIGDEATLHALALFEDLAAAEEAAFEDLKREYGGDERMAFNDKRYGSTILTCDPECFGELCDRVREFIDAQA